MMRYGAKNGFMVPAVIGLFRTRFSNVPAASHAPWAYAYDPEAMIAS